MEKHDIVHVLLDLHEWRMDAGSRAVFFNHVTGEEGPCLLTIRASVGTDDDDISSNISIEYEEEDVGVVVERIEAWKDKVEKYERVSRGVL